MACNKHKFQEQRLLRYSVFGIKLPETGGLPNFELGPSQRDPDFIGIEMIVSTG